MVACIAGDIRGRGLEKGSGVGELARKLVGRIQKTPALIAGTPFPFPFHALLPIPLPFLHWPCRL